MAGDMPGTYVCRDEWARLSYIEGVFNTLILRDIRQKYRIRKPEQLERFCSYSMGNISNVTSVGNVAETFRRNGLALSDKTLSAYLGYLCDAFAFYRVRRYDIHGKRYLTLGDKYYLVDPAFRYAKLGTRSLGYGRMYENLVATELIRRGYEVYAGTLYQKEVDFVAMRRDEKLYIQVRDDISAPQTFEREYDPLLWIRDACPKMIIARTWRDAYDYEGSAWWTLPAGSWGSDGRWYAREDKR